MTRRAAVPLLVGGLLAGVLGATACSGSAAPVGAAAPAPAPTEDTGRPTPRTDPGNDADQFKDAATNAKRADDLLGTGDCIQTGAAFSALIAEPAALAAGGADPSRIAQFRTDIEALRTEVPDELKADMDTLAQAYESAAGGLAGFGKLDASGDPADLRKKTQDAEAAIQTLQAPAVKAAEQHLTSYFDDCTTRITR